REIARTEPLHGVGADMPALEPAGSRAIVDRECRDRAAGGDAQQKIGIEQMIDAHGAARGPIAETRAANARIARKLLPGTKSRGPRMPLRLRHRGRLDGVE